MKLELHYNYEVDVNYTNWRCWIHQALPEIMWMWWAQHQATRPDAIKNDTEYLLAYLWMNHLICRLENLLVR